MNRSSGPDGTAARAIKNIKLARDAAVARLVDDAAEFGAELLVLKRDDASLVADRSTIRTRSELAGCADTLRLVHKRAYEDCLLSIPDAVAWAWMKAGRWRDRVKPLVSEVIYVTDQA